MQHLRAYFRLIKDVLARLSRLQKLHLHRFEQGAERHSDILEKCVFPRLDTLVLSYLDGLCTANFLGRHPNIATLSILTAQENPPIYDFQVHLPNLKVYIGHARIFPFWLSRCRSLQHLVIAYDYQHRMTAHTFKMLSFTNAERLDLLLAGWNLECCLVVSRTLPALKAMSFENIGGDQTVKASDVRGTCPSSRVLSANIIIHPSVYRKF